jgi:hypothetical protein
MARIVAEGHFFWVAGGAAAQPTSERLGGVGAGGGSLLGERGVDSNKRQVGRE